MLVVAGPSRPRQLCWRARRLAVTVRFHYAPTGCGCGDYVLQMGHLESIVCELSRIQPRTFTRLSCVWWCQPVHSGQPRWTPGSPALCSEIAIAIRGLHGSTTTEALS